MVFPRSGAAATLTATRPASRPATADRRRRRWAWWGSIGGLAVAAFVARLLFTLHDGGFLDVHDYDAGVYYAAADALIHHQMPYQSFLFIEAPGVTLITAPFAALGSLTTDAVGLAAANLAFAAMGTASTAMVTVNLRRFGMPAALAGGFFYAVTDAVVTSERSIRLEPPATLLILISLVLLTNTRPTRRSRRAFIAGILLGAAIGFKIWYVVPALVVLLVSRGRRRPILAGVVAGAFVIYLPFFLPAPTLMLRQVVLDQLGRPRDPISLASRVHGILGEPSVPGSLTRLGFTTTELSAILLVVAAAAVVVAWRVRRARLYVLLLVTGAGVLLASPSFFAYYAALTSFPLAVVLGVAFGRLVAALHAPGGMTAAASVLVMAGMLAVSLPKEIHASDPAAPLTGLRSAVARVHGCVLSDNNAILAATNVLTRDLRQGCLIWPDTTGWAFDAYAVHPADHRAVSRMANPLWQAHAVGYLTSGAAVIPYYAGTLLDHRSTLAVRHGTTLFQGGEWAVYATPRRLGPAPSTPALLAWAAHGGAHEAPASSRNPH
ncbi:MAG TPA: glycosyltransferase 87 family protein [Microbacteriaceae bacterium]|nr:glycosyltransferase 87 family protein [Microbacteriaceae bacterium]